MKKKNKKYHARIGRIKIIKILKKENNFINVFNKYNIESNFYKFLAGFIANLQDLF